MSSERAYWVAWSQISGVGPVLLKRLHQHFRSLAQAWQASPAELIQVEGIGLLLSDQITSARSQLDPEDLLKEHDQRYPCFWTPADADYPQLLWEITDPPPILYYRGQPDPQENSGQIPTVGIVGTRRPSDYGRRWTRRLSKSLARNGFTIVSGLAEGIDTEAHDSCIQGEGRTIAVLGTGVDVIYPLSNRFLYRRVLEQGLVVSEYPDGTQPDRAHFPRRNRIIAGLSRATLVMEAPYRSGALITARLANDYGRDVYVLPGALDSPRSLGCLDLLNQGAHVILGEGHLLEALGAMPRLQVVDSSRVPESPPFPHLDPHLEKVFRAIPIEPISLDRIVQELGLPVSEISSALMQLEIMGLVLQLPGMQYQRS